MKTSRRLVFSVYSHVLEDYPYYPFIADSVSSGIKKFIRFCDSRNSICEGAELHWIGTCEEYFDTTSEHRSVLENIQPLMFPQRIIFKRDFLGRIVSRCFVLGLLFHDKVVRYIQEFLSKKGIEKHGK